MELFPQALVTGLESGCLYILVALGLSLILGVMKTVNFAHGEFVMLGAYFTFYFFSSTGMNYPVAFVLTLVTMFGLGFALEKALFRPIRGNMLAGFILTLGISIFLLNLGFIVFGTKSRGMSEVFSGLVEFGSVHTSVQKIATSAIAVSLMAVLLLIIYRTKLGRAFRAIAIDSEAAQLQGVNTGTMSSLCLAISLALAGAAGALLGVVFNVYPTMGTRATGLAFVIIVTGGLGSIPGAIVAALIIGLVESFVSTYVGGDISWGVIFLVALLTIAFKPKGLLGRN
jgi:branched-chain amino acid transport system permease protein